MGTEIVLLARDITIRRRDDLENRPWQIDYLTRDKFDAHLCDTFRQAFELYMRLLFGISVEK